jgi:poly(hydroxyalkanoate) depolymerase family esterase
MVVMASAIVLAGLTWFSGFAGTVPTAAAGRLEQFRLAAGAYRDSRARDVAVFIPDSYTGQAAVPMVMVLHGCSQTNENMINETAFTDLAERDGFIVVFPFITSYDGLRNQNCWGFWFDQHIHEGGGEPEDLYQIALAVEQNFSIDPQRRFVTGLSSGGAMAAVLGVVQSEYFAAFGSVEGLVYGETPSAVARSCQFPGTFRSVAQTVAAIRAEQTTEEERRTVPAMAIHSLNDCTVNIEAARRLRDTWLELYGVSPTPVEQIDCTGEGVACQRQRFGTPQRSTVETVFYEGRRGDAAGQGSHYWVGDKSGPFANPTGPSASALLWAFFQRHPFSPGQAPAVTVASAVAQGTTVRVDGSATDPDGSVVQVRVRLDGAAPQPEIDAQLTMQQGTAQWSATFIGVPDNTLYTPAATAVDKDGLKTTVAGPAVQVGTPPANTPPDVTVTRAGADQDCVTVEGAATDTGENPGGTVREVAVELGGRLFQAAALGQGSYRYQECQLPAGNYAVRVRATDDLGAVAFAAGPSVQVESVRSVTATWLDHQVAGRLRVYLAPCPNIGFGSCDAGFPQIFQTHGSNPFPLFSRAGGADWFLDPANIP